MSIDSVLKSAGFKILLVVVAAFIGTIGGIFAARGLFERREPAKQLQEGCESGGLFLTFGPGDPFPNERYRDRSGLEADFAELIAGRNTLLVFVEFGCEACISLVDAWNAELGRHVRDGSQTIFCTSVLKGIPEEYRDSCDSLNFVYYDFDYWFNEYGLTATPVIMGIDSNGIVTHVQLGFTGHIDPGLASRYFEPLL